MGAKARTASYTKIMPDTRYGSLLASKFINCLMHDGKKATATRVFYDAMDQIKNRMKDVDPLVVFTDAVNNVKPTLEVRSRRVGGAGALSTRAPNMSERITEIAPKTKIHRIAR